MAALCSIPARFGCYRSNKKIVQYNTHKGTIFTVLFWLIKKQGHLTERKNINPCISGRKDNYTKRPIDSSRRSDVYTCIRLWNGPSLIMACRIMMTSSNGNIFRVSGPLCGEFNGPCEFPTQRPVTRSFDVFFDLRLNKRLSKQPWFEPSWSLWRHCNVFDDET